MNCKLITNKQKQIVQLTNQNNQYETKLIKLTAQHQDAINNYHHLNQQFQNLTNILVAQNIRSSMLNQSIDKLASQIDQETDNYCQVSKQLENQLQKNKNLNAQLYKKQQEVQDLELLICRMNKQLKTNLNLQKSAGNNIIKSYEQKKKRLDTAVRTVQILNNKYESLYKFLKILEAKKQKQMKSQKQSQKPVKTLRKQNYKLNGNYSQISIKKEQQVKIVDREKIKRMDTQIRKRNMILMKKQK